MVQSECPSKFRIRAWRGFSIVEMLVAVSIAGLLSAIVVPAFSYLIDQYRITVASNALMSAFVAARQSAIAKNQVVTICSGNPESGCHANWGSGEWLIFTDRNQNGAREADDFLIQSGSANLGSGIRILANRPLQKPVHFQPIGHAEQPSGAFAAGTLRLCRVSSDTAPGIDLVLSKSGHIRTQTHNVGGNCSQP